MNNLILKFYSDMANMQKDDKYHTIAAYASAIFLYGFIRRRFRDLMLVVLCKNYIYVS